MAREPSSSAHRYNEAVGRSGAVEPPPPPPPPPKKPRALRVRVEPAKPKSDERARLRAREEALTKALTTTVQLTAEERGLLRELRAADPNAAGQALARIQQAKREKERGR